MNQVITPKQLSAQRLFASSRGRYREAVPDSPRRNEIASEDRICEMDYERWGGCRIRSRLSNIARLIGRT
jgi:hypothetical protein